MSYAVGPGDLVLCVNAAPNHATGKLTHKFVEIRVNRMGRSRLLQVWDVIGGAFSPGLFHSDTICGLM